MRLLCDENADRGLPRVLESLGHEADHMGDLDAGAGDPRVAEIASGYDVLVTLDLHRQGSDWLAVTEAILRNSAKVVRLRFRPAEGTALMDQARALIAKWEKWEEELFVGAGRLATIQDRGMSVRTATEDEVKEMLRSRLGN